MVAALVMRSTLFQSTPSARRATGGRWCKAGAIIDFNPRPPRGGRLRRRSKNILDAIISIHALREEGDSMARVSSSGFPDFNPRPPRGGRLLLHR